MDKALKNNVLSKIEIEQLKSIFRKSPHDSLANLITSIFQVDYAVITVFLNGKEFVTGTNTNLLQGADEIELYPVFIESTPQYFDTSKHSLTELEKFKDSRNLQTFPLINKSDYYLGAVYLFSNNSLDLNKSIRKQLELIIDEISKSVQSELYSVKLKVQRDRFSDILNSTKNGIWEWSIDTDKIHINERWANIVGYTVEELSPISVGKWQNFIHPDEIDDVVNSFNQALKNTSNIEWAMEYRFIRKDGSEAVVNDQVTINRNDKGEIERVVGVLTDISTEYYYNQFDKIEMETIELSMKPDVPMTDVLLNFTKKLEDIFPRMWVSIMGVYKGKLYNLATPSLPKECIDSVTGVEIGPNKGSCGTAAYEKKKIIVSNIFEDKRWENYTHLGEMCGFKACWSTPIFDSKGKVVATFANYYRDIATPSELEEHIIERSERLISLLYNKFEYVRKIKKSNERYEIVNKATKDAIYDWDIRSNKITWGDGFMRLFHYDSAPPTLSEWESLIHPDDVKAIIGDLNEFLHDRDEQSWSVEYRFRRKNGSYVWVEEIGYLIRNSQGKPKRMIGAIRDISRDKEISIQKEVRHKLSHLFKEKAQLADILIPVLDYFLNLSSFSLAEVWLASSDQEHINLLAKHASSDQAKKFHEQTATTKQFTYDEGMPGRAWSEENTTIWDLTKTDKFIRKKEALDNGIQFICGIPIYDNSEVIGTLVLGDSHPIDKNKPEFVAIEKSKGFLGSEIKRKKQENEMNLLFESAPDILGVVNPNGFFINVNPAFCELLGYTREELINSPFSGFIHPNDLDLTNKEFTETVNGSRNAQNFINRYRDKNGDYKWISWNSSDPFGEDGLVFSFGRDITEFMELQTLMNNATGLARVGGWEVDLTNNQMYWSDMTKKIHGLTPDHDPTFDEALKFYREDHQELVTSIFIDALSEGKEFDFEAPIIKTNGEECWIRIMGSAEMQNDKPVRIYGSMQDIHSQKKSEFELLRFREVIKNSRDGIGIVDKEGHPIYVNPWFSKMLGHTVESLEELGGPAAAYADKSIADRLFTKLLNGNYWKGDVKLVNKTGKKVDFHLSAGPIFNNKGEQIAAYGIHTDITERKRHEESLKKLNEQLKEVAWIQSHTVRAPLAKIMGLIKLIDNKTQEELKENNLLPLISSSAEELDKIIKDIIDKSQKALNQSNDTTS